MEKSQKSEESNSPSGKSSQSPNSPNKQARIFISYKSKDSIFAETSPQNTNMYEKSKRDRQEMQKLNQVMLNRVQLLAQQEEKLNKKISESKNYANNIQGNKSRLNQEKMEKEKRQKEAEKELMLKKEKVNYMKNEQKIKNEQAKQMLFQDKISETQTIKQQKQQHEQYINQFNQSLESNNQLKRMALQQEYAQGNEKIKEFYLRKKLEVQQQIQNLVQMETEQKKQLEQEFKRLEEEESKQLQKLKETKENERHVEYQLLNVKAASPNSKMQSQENTNQAEFSDPTLITNQVLLESSVPIEETKQNDEEINN